MANSAAALHILVKHKEQAEDIIKQLKRVQSFRLWQKSTLLALQERREEIWVSFVADRWLRNLTKFAFRERHLSLT